MIPLNIYCDGACSGNQNKTNVGGWGAILEYGKHTKELFGGEKDTTNNRMELSALVYALSSVTRDGENICVFSDSAYLINGMKNRWYETWQKNGWKTANKMPVENRPLWEKILSFLPSHTFSFYHVKGHVNPTGKQTNLAHHYERFCEKNGSSFSHEDFLHITKMNNLADALANKGIDQIRIR
ncbi:MAG: ribonuclease HI [Clostridiales Family XIII bacterium]|jgi:ribonuclease HI|nr:ribonuclease HI [Clostridiales Family XIII bacterium]